MQAIIIFLEKLILQLHKITLTLQILDKLIGFLM